SLEFFRNFLLPHLDVDDKALFPFVLKHIPKLEPVLALLKGEHIELKKSLKASETAIKNMKNQVDIGKRSLFIDKLKNNITYFISLLRNHIQTENEGVYKVVKASLKADEVSFLDHEIQKICKEGTL
ncbi:MAG: hemerythrin domain-containing protein, partial [Candidatus Omnitrophica bacterium]|nr:hemerythrin domain-containing protein [Candidatus Omnitrophota bacterium]